MPSIIFFGSFQHYSTIILKALHQNKNLNIQAIVTTAPRISITHGKKTLLKTQVQEYAEKHHLPLYTPEKLNLKSLPSRPASTRGEQAGLAQISNLCPDFFVVAGYRHLLPPSWLKFPQIASLNIHFSLLPKYRGANPAEWAILIGETQTGVSLIKMTKKLDQGPILAQQKLAITSKDTRETLYQKLYELAAGMITKYLRTMNYELPTGKPQPTQPPTPFARLLSRQDGFIPWPILQKAIKGKPIQPKELPPLLQEVSQYLSTKNTSIQHSARFESARRVFSIQLIERAIRALSGYPGVWTIIKTSKGKKRMKLLSAKLDAKRFTLVPKLIQLEGHTPTTFNQLKTQLI